MTACFVRLLCMVARLVPEKKKIAYCRLMILLLVKIFAVAPSNACF